MKYHHENHIIVFTVLSALSQRGFAFKVTASPKVANLSMLFIRQLTHTDTSACQMENKQHVRII